MNFWSNAQTPFYALAPMEDVTDTVFRQVVMSVSNPRWLNVLFTEFTNVDGLLNDNGSESVRQRLVVSESERLMLKQNQTKLVAQIWGNDPEKFYRAAQFITKNYAFDGIDINMGCPVKKVVKKATCSGLIQYPELAKKIVEAAQLATHLPISVKTRIGFNRVQTEEWISELLKMQPAAITIHGRTQKQMSNGKADWAEIAKAVELRNQLSPDTRILGNGDVTAAQVGHELLKKHQLDGFMVGRGIFNNPWMFSGKKSGTSVKERLNLMNSHVEWFEKEWGDSKNYHILKRFFKIYIQEFEGAANLRAELMETNSYEAFYTLLSTLDLAA